MRRIEVTIESKHCAYVKGYGSRDLLTELRGRPPVWSTLTRAWVTTEATARDLIAVAESRGYEVLVSPELVDRRGDHLLDQRDEHHLGLDPGRGLW